MDEWEQLQEKLEKLTSPIGRLVIEFASLEELLNSMLIETISGHDEDLGLIIIKDMGYSAKTKLFSNLNKFKIASMCDSLKPLIKEFKAIIKDLEKAGQMRNEIVHAAWYELNPSDSKVKVKTKVKKGFPSHIQKPLTINEIDDTTKFINKLEGQLDDFWERQSELLYTGLYNQGGQ